MNSRKFDRTTEAPSVVERTHRIRRRGDSVLILAMVSLAALTFSGAAMAQPGGPPGASAASQPVKPPEIVTGFRKANTGPIPAPTVELKPGEAPKPKFETLEHAFGSVQAGQEVTNTFKFTNTGNGTLEILAVRPSCGCTTPGEYARIIKPGESGSIPVVIDTTKLSGKVSKSVMVHTNAPGLDNLAILTIHGEVTPIYKVNPPKVEFGAMKIAEARGKTFSKSVQIFSQIDRPLELKNLRSSNPHFTADMKTVEAGKRYEITVTLAGDFRVGSNGSYIEVDTNWPEASDIRIPAAIFIEAPIDVMPTQVVISANRTVAFSRAFFVRNNTDSPIKLNGVRVTNPLLKATIEETTPGMAWKVVVDIPVEFKGSVGGDRVTIVTSHPEIPELIADILVKQPPSQAVSATTQSAESPAGFESAPH